VRLTFLVALVALAFSASAQTRLSGKGQYPQSRTLSGLAGGGSGVAPSGKPSLRGALAMSTPIGYTLGENSAVLTGGTTSATGSPRWFDGDVATNGSNGTATAMFGLTFGGSNLGVSIVQTSRLSEDRVLNVQFSPRRMGRLGLSFGVQDLFDETVTTPDYHESAQTVFAAATYGSEGVYLTAGGGNRRFRQGFAGLSAPVTNGVRAMAEHDGFGWNYGVEVRLFDVHSSRASLFYGLCQGRYATWALSWQF